MLMCLMMNKILLRNWKNDKEAAQGQVIFPRSPLFLFKKIPKED